MESQTLTHGPTAIVRLGESMGGYDDCNRLQLTVREMLDSGTRDFIINLRDVSYLGPAGIDAIVATAEMAARAGATLKLAELPDHARRALADAGADRLFDILPEPSESDASRTTAPGTTTMPPAPPPRQWDSKMTIEFPSAEGNIAEAARRFTSFLEQLRMDSPTLCGLQVAFSEAFANAVQHGNKADPSKCVVAECIANGQMLKIRVTDEGEGFDTATTIALRSNPFHDGGHGLNLITTLMDEVRYNDKGNSVSMVKLCSQPLPKQQHGNDHEQVSQPAER